MTQDSLLEWDKSWLSIDDFGTPRMNQGMVEMDMRYIRGGMSQEL